jgi:chemotaxis protein CheZ
MENAALQTNENEQLDAARRLVEALERGDQGAADACIGDLTSSASTLYQDVGKLTRELHEALKSVRIDSEVVELAEHEIPDAKERLHYVIAKTEDATHRTLNAVEESLPVTEDLKTFTDEMREEWSRFRRREMDLEEFKVFGDRLEGFFEQVTGSTENLQSKLSDVLMAQDYQDLTGQVIRRVIDLVQEVESNLLRVIQRTGSKTKCTEAAGPQITTSERKSAVSSQEEADDILASLGF